MIFYSSGSNTSVSGISFPFPGSDGAIPVSKDGQWAVGVDKDPKANSVEATTNLSANEFTGNYVNIETVDHLQGIIIQPDSVVAADLTAYSGTGGGVGLAIDGIYIMRGMEFVHLTREKLIELTTLDSSGVNPTVNGGYMTVPYARGAIAGDIGLQITYEQNESLAIVWTQEVAHVFGPFSIHLSQVAAPGNLSWALIDLSGPTPMAMGSVETGSSPGYIRVVPTEENLLGSSYQLYPGRQYFLGIEADPEGSVDVTIPYGKQGTDPKSNLVPGVTCLNIYGNPLTQDGEPAQAQVILCSAPNYHSSQLVWGWDGSHGDKVALYEGSAWVIRDIPDEGLFYDYSWDSTGIRNAYLQYAGGALELHISSTGYSYQDGIRIKIPNYEGDIRGRFLGQIECISLSSPGA